MANCWGSEIVSTTRELEARFGALRMPAGAVPTGATRVMLLSILISLGVLLAVPILQAPAAPAVLLVSLWLGGMAWAFVRTAGLQRDLRQARVRALDATDLERRRIQRDLHDSAQQRLVSVRIQLGLLAERATSEDDRASIDQLGRGLDRYDAPREILARITGRPPEEFIHRREHADCSGGGGLVPATRPASSAAIADGRIAEHRALGGGLLVTHCAQSLRRFRTRGEPAEDLASLVARAVTPR